MHEWEYLKQPFEGLMTIIRTLPKEAQSFHLHGSFGDVYMQLAALQEIATEGNQITAIIDPRYETLAKLALERRCTLFYWNGPAVNSILTNIRINVRSNGYPIRLLPTLYPYIPECILSRKLKYIDFLRILTNSSKQGSLPEIETDPNLKSDAASRLASVGLPIGKTAILSADNNSQVELPDFFWHSVITIVESLGWEVGINSSGNLESKGAKWLARVNKSQIDIPPHLAITIPQVAGCYFSGTNGFATLQAHFNRGGRGIHFINGYHAHGGKIRDKGGNLIDVESFYHENMYLTDTMSNQTELYVDANTTYEVLEEAISSVLFQVY